MAAVALQNVAPWKSPHLAMVGSVSTSTVVTANVSLRASTCSIAGISATLTVTTKGFGLPILTRLMQSAVGAS